MTCMWTTHRSLIWLLVALVVFGFVSLNLFAAYPDRAFYLLDRWKYGSQFSLDAKCFRLPPDWVLRDTSVSDSYQLMRYLKGNPGLATVYGGSVWRSYAGKVSDTKLTSPTATISKLQSNPNSGVALFVGHDTLSGVVVTASTEAEVKELLAMLSSCN